MGTKALEGREMSTPPTPQLGYGTFTFTICLTLYSNATKLPLLLHSSRIVRGCCVSYDAKMKRFKEKNGLLVEAWPALDKWELQRDQVVLNRRLGEGAFGTVYGGEALIDDCWLAVAVKTLKVGSNIEAKVI